MKCSFNVSKNVELINLGFNIEFKFVIYSWNTVFILSCSSQDLDQCPNLNTGQLQFKHLSRKKVKSWKSLFIYFWYEEMNHLFVKMNCKSWQKKKRVKF